MTKNKLKPTTKTEIVKEILKCGSDPVYFILNYCQIQHPIKGLIPFTLFEFQKDIIKAYLDHRKNIILKARQLGVTTVTAAFICWLMLFHKDKNVVIIATKQDTAKSMIRIVKTIFKHLPTWLILCGFDINNTNSVELENGSRVKAYTTSDDVGRSEAVSFLIVDECSFIKNFSDLWTGLKPVVSTGGRVVLMSTPNGAGNFFHQEYVKAQLNENGFNCRFGTYTNPNDQEEIYDDRFMWWVHPEHDLMWFKEETRDFSKRKVAQEYLANFNASGDTLINSEDLSYLRSKIRDPIDKTNFDKNLWIWEYPIPGSSYLISADIARGDSFDYTTFQVLRLDGKLIQAAEYKGKITPDVLGTVLMETSKKYNNAIIAPENNSGWSGQTVQKIKEANYSYLYYSNKRDKTFIDPFYAQSIDILPGYTVSSVNRMDMLIQLEEFIRMKYIDLFSERLVAEFETFIYINNKPQAQRGSNDDLVMSLAGGLWVRNQSFAYISKTSEVAKMMIGCISNNQMTTEQFNDFNYSQTMYTRGQIKQHIQNQNKIIIGTGEAEDLTWLISS